MKRLWIGALAVLLAGCSQAVQLTPTADLAGPTPLSLPAAPLPSTFTPPPPPLPLPTFTAAPSLTPLPSATPINFDQTAVELRYTIPAIGLDRRLQANVGGQLILVDETTGEARQFNNQGGILLQLQQTLPDLTLEPPPSGCDTCVQLRFDLPFSELAGEGWLQDPILLASIENYMSARLGPHFPPGTQVGFRRGVSAYAPAHTLALMADGRLWRWLATDTQLSSPTDAAVTAPNLAFLAANAPSDSLNENYMVDCAGTAVESLMAAPNAPIIRISCPEFSLPNTLLPLYLTLDEALAPIIADVSAPRPPSAFPLTALLDYQRADAARLTIHWDGTAVVLDTAAQPYTGTVTASQIISLTNALLDSGQLQLGLTTFEPTVTPAATVITPTAVSRILLRGPDGVYDGQWPDASGSDAPDFADLNALLDSLLGNGLPTAVSPTATAVPEP